MLKAIKTKISESIQLLQTYKNKKYDKILFDKLNEVVPSFYTLQQLKLSYITDTEFDTLYNYLYSLNSLELKEKIIPINKLSTSTFVQNYQLPKNKEDFYKSIMIFMAFEKPFYHNPIVSDIYNCLKDIIYIAIEANKFLIKNHSIKMNVRFNSTQYSEDFEMVLFESLIRKLYSFNPNASQFSTYFYAEIENQTKLYINKIYNDLNKNCEIFEDYILDINSTEKKIENIDTMITFFSFVYFNYPENDFNFIKDNITDIYKGNTIKIQDKTRKAFKRFRKEMF